jgi:hypothetical protein
VVAQRLLGNFDGATEVEDFFYISVGEIEDPLYILN